MSIIREFEVFLTETTLLVSLLNIGCFCSAGSWIRFSGVLQHSTKQHQQDMNQPEQHARQMPGSAKRV
jgi:hypothetical protein